ncbi:MAG: DUF4190 domain-containing protein [Ruminococcus sp.]|nr:DUF4190 domain-containing protein [Ruminococcus sp.]
MDNNYNNDNNQNQFNQANDPYSQPAGFDPYSGSSAPTSKTSGFAIASLVLGIISIVICCTTYIGGIVGILAIIFGAVAIKKTGKSGLAVAGLVCGVVGAILGFGYLIVILIKGEELISWAEKLQDAALFIK